MKYFNFNLIKLLSLIIQFIYLNFLFKRASSAAPGYYEDFKLDGYIFHDGGVLANNPTAIAIHEAKLLWPKTEINSVISIGNGRYKPEGYASSKANSVSLKQKINRFVAGISSTESNLIKRFQIIKYFII